MLKTSQTIFNHLYGISNWLILGNPGDFLRENPIISKSIPNILTHQSVSRDNNDILVASKYKVNQNLKLKSAKMSLNQRYKLFLNKITITEKIWD